MAAKTKATGRLVAAVRLEYPGGGVRRVEPGEPIPDDFPRESIAELRKHKAIVTEGEQTAADRNLVAQDSGSGA